MSTLADPSTPDCQRLRIRFRKTGDARWISHRDLMRAVERLCRRAGLKPRMSEGFHPKPKLSFPSALALGIEGLDEVMELQLVEPVEPAELARRLNAFAPPGLTVTAATALAPGERKTKIRSMQYQFPVPDQWRAHARTAIENMKAATTLPIYRDGRQHPIDILANLASIEFSNGVLYFRLRATDQAAARPRDLLETLGLRDLEQQGQFLTRSNVEVVS
ncbi:MAG: TIGR03936 family radical SAM-associated protein [Planctomycetota bacterium]